MIGEKLHEEHLKRIDQLINGAKVPCVIFADGNIYVSGDKNDQRADEILKNELENKRIMAAQFEDYRFSAAFEVGDKIPKSVEALRDLMMKQSYTNRNIEKPSQKKTVYTVK